MSVVSSVPGSGLTAQEGIPEWDQNSTTTLIQMYKERKCLWDTSHEFYKNRRLRREALTEMANHFNCSLADVEKKLYMLRSSFRKEYRRWNYAKLNAGPNNTSLVRKPQWFALDLLMFLKDDVAKKSLIPLNPADAMDCSQQQQVQQSQQQQLQQHQQSQQEVQQQQQDLDLNTPEIQNVFYYDSENSTLTPLEPGEVTLDYNIQPIQVPDVKQSPGKTLKRSSSVEPNLLELNSKRQKSKDSEDSRLRVIKASSMDVQEKDAFTAFGNFVAEELRNIKDGGQMQLAKLRIHQILFDATRNFLKVPIPRL
ncbi:hypothetical protein KPH14_009508 [Odynerus spinipes]|uniref:MADF domain-containing protein n=1 Tax=Odynerus spinipes TaxID=1348599 RepID=A0AAD9RPJ3_9HYME|nr:hypothetical protein KPH14_009508 [Odynerus spinipes]